MCIANGGGWPLIGHMATETARSWSHIDQVVGGEHHIAVVLYDEDRVLCITELLEGVYEHTVVALVQADAWLISYIEYLD